MTTVSSAPVRRRFFVVLAAGCAIGGFVLAQGHAVPKAEAEDSVNHSYPAQSGAEIRTIHSTNSKDVRGPVFEPLANEPAAKIVVDPPLAGPLARGVVVIQFRTENLRILPVFGSDAAKISPRIGHLHVTLDDAPWHWGNTSGEPLIVSGLPAGNHKILVELADANHQILDKAAVSFVIPK